MTTKKTTTKKVLRKNQNKEELKNQMEQNAKNEHVKSVVRAIYPFLEKLDSVYDAQTAVNATAGYIMSELKTRIAQVKVSHLGMKFSDEINSKMKDAILAIYESIKDENVEDAASTLERLGKTLEGYTAFHAMKQPISTVKLEDILA